MTTPIKRLPSWVLDSKLTPAQRAQGERDERNTDIVDKQYETAVKQGPTIDVSGAAQMGATTFEQLAAYSGRGDVPTLMPLDVKVGPEYPGGFHYILSEEDYRAVLEGRYCERCLDKLPAIYTLSCPTCEWPREFVHKDKF